MPLRLEVRLFVLNCFGGVDNEICPHLLELGGVSEDGRDILVFTHDLNTVDAVRGQSQDIIDSPPNINFLEIVGIGARVSLQGLGKGNNAFSRGQH